MPSPEQLVADIRLAQKGDEEAWARLLGTYRPVLESWASTFSINGEMSQSDLVQDAWFQIWKGLDKFKGVDKPDCVAPMFYQWLKATAKNAMLSRLKHRNAQRRSPKNRLVPGQHDVLADPIGRTPSSIVSHDEQLDNLHQAVCDISDPLDQQIVTMATTDGLSLKVIAEVLGKDYSTIRRRFHSVLGRLGKDME